MRADEVAERFPAHYPRRLQEHGVSEEGQNYWSDLCAGLSAADA